MDELIIISPELRPGKGGVADYTIRLLETWASPENVRVLVPSAGIELPSSSPFRVDVLRDDASSICQQLPARGGRVLLQYSAYGYNFIGYPRQLIRAMVDWKQRSGGTLVIVFHEIWTFWPTLNKNAPIQYLHRRGIKRLVQTADVVFTTTRSQAEHLGFGSPKSVRVLPVGSTVRRTSDVSIPPRQKGQAVLFGLQQTRIRTLKEMKDSLGQLAAARRLSTVITMGLSDSKLDGVEANHLRDLGLTGGFEQRGRQSESAISQLLLTSSFGISAQDELSYEKSSTFMAYAAHELNILNEHADSNKPEPLSWLVAPNELLQGISDLELRARAQHLYTWQRQTSSWESIGAKLSDALGLDDRAAALAQHANG